MYGAALAEAARGLLDARSGGSGHSSFYHYDDDDDVGSTASDELLKSGCMYLGVSMNGNRPFTYDSTTAYGTTPSKTHFRPNRRLLPSVPDSVT